MNIFRYAGNERGAPYHIPRAPHAIRSHGWINRSTHPRFLVWRAGRYRTVPHRPACPVVQCQHAQPTTPVASRFGACVEQALGGDLETWARQRQGPGGPDSPAGPVHPQYLPRHCRRLCRRLSCPGTGTELHCQRPHQRLPAIHQVFLYLPLEHCEDLDVQEECVTLFEELAAVTGNADRQLYPLRGGPPGGDRPVRAFSAPQRHTGARIQRRRSWPTWRSTAGFSYRGTGIPAENRSGPRSSPPATRRNAAVQVIVGLHDGFVDLGVGHLVPGALLAAEETAVLDSTPGW